MRLSWVEARFELNLEREKMMKKLIALVALASLMAVGCAHR